MNSLDPRESFLGQWICLKSNTAVDFWLVPGMPRLLKIQEAIHRASGEFMKQIGIGIAIVTGNRAVMDAAEDR
jgi:hypothetical protein